MNMKQNEFEVRRNKIPVAPNQNFFTGHLVSIYLNPYSCLRIHDLHKKLGHTFELLLLDTVCIATTDLDLLKTMLVEEAADHLDRPSVVFPFEELRLDSLARASKYKWLRMRKAIAPAFS